MPAIPAWRRCIAAFSLAAASALCHADVAVMVLGSYHFGNPGLDAVNTRVDDVLQPRRQAELQRLAGQLAGFSPTKVMVERLADQHEGNRLPSYADWRAGQLRERRNEIEQIGYRLADRMGHEAVFGVDAEGNFPYEELQAFAEKTGQQAPLDAAMAELQARAKRFEQNQLQRTVSQLLATLNDPAAVLRDHFFYSQALRFGRGAEQPGAELLAQWATRNVRICARVVQLARPGDRIVLLYGSGHAYLLRQCVKEQPGWTLVEPVKYLR